ncbi:MAG: TetR family transcriptional regulator [Streptosporangiales bacterium]|nr:TetR family transcriptional regulator [Streptosporangiales bacterium]
MPQATRRSRNKKGEGDRLRHDLVAAAADLLREHGTDAGLSMREVTRRAGVSAPALYLHFADGRELVDAVLAQQFAALTERLAAAVATAGDETEELRAGCRAYLDFADRDPAMYRLLFEGGITRRPDQHTGQGAPGRETFDYLVTGIARCQRTGAITVADQQTTATLTWTGLHGIATLRRAHPDFPWPTLDTLLDDLLHRLTGLPPRP